MDYFTTTYNATPHNLTQYTYFKIEKHSDTLNHKMQIFDDHINTVNKSHIPDKQSKPVAQTPFDFRSPRDIGEAINADHEQIKNGFGYDHNFLINQTAYKAMTLAARAEEKVSGRVLEVFTEEPGVQFYSGNFLDGSL